MAAFDHSLVTLRFFGDDLLPEEVSACSERLQPHRITRGRNSEATNQAPCVSPGLEAGNLMRRVVSLKIWKRRSSRSSINSPAISPYGTLARFRPDLFCGLFMGSSNDGVSLSPRALLALGERGIELGLDIYEADEEVRNAQRQQAIS